MDHHALLENVLDERPSLRLHLREFLRGVDEEIQAPPHVVDSLEVEEAFEERPVSLGDDYQVQVAPLVGLAAGDRAEDDRFASAPKVRREALLECIEVLYDHVHVLDILARYRVLWVGELETGPVPGRPVPGRGAR